jgi:hypothetical protein
MEVTGKIKFIGTVQQVTDSFKKRELVVTTDEQYPQHLLIEFAQDKCGILDGYKVGESVTVGINLRGREWINPQSEVKYFNQIQGWKINKSGEASEPTQTHEAVPLGQESKSKDLPF